MLFQQGFHIEVSQELTEKLPITSSGAHKEWEGAACKVETTQSRHPVSEISHSVLQQGRRRPSVIATQSRDRLGLIEASLHPRIWSIQQYESKLDRIGAHTVCSTPALTASSGSIPESFASGPECYALPSGLASSHAGWIGTLLTPEATHSSLRQLLIATTHPFSRADYGQMFSPQNDLGYLSSVQGHQSCLQKNTELAESFIQMRVEFFAIVQQWPREEGIFLSKTDPYTGIWCDRWENEFDLLIEETIDYWQLRMLDEKTERVALDVCADCLEQYIPRDSIFKMITGLRRVLTPDIEYDDWCRHAPDLADEDEPCEQYATTHSRNPAASSPGKHLPVDNDRQSPGTAGLSDIDSELHFNVVFDD